VSTKKNAGRGSLITLAEPKVINKPGPNTNLFDDLVWLSGGRGIWPILGNGDP